jgi:hypothetical protein
MKAPKPLFALVCDNGRVYLDEDDDRPAVFPEHFQAMEYLDLLGSSGWKCACDDHRIVEYRPAKLTRSTL